MERSDRPAEVSSRGPQLLALFWIGVGCVLRLSGLTVHSLWYDEGGTLAVALAERPLEVLKLDRHPPLSHLATRAWAGLFGESDLALRALPALVSCCALLAFAAWVRGRRGATLATALFAVAPFQVWHGQELRMYVFTECASLLALLGFERVRRGARGGLPLVALGTAAATGSHYMGALIAPALIAAAWLARKRLPGRGFWGVVAAASLGVLAWVPWLWSYLGSQRSVDWGRLGRTDALAVLELPARQLLLGLGATPGYEKLETYVVGAVLALGWLVVGAPLVRQRGERDVELAVLAALPILLAFALDAAFDAGFLAKYAIAAAPAVTLAAAEGLTALSPAWLRRALALAVVLALAAQSLRLRQVNMREDFRSASADLLASWMPGDRVVVVTSTPEPFASAAVRHYVRTRPDVAASILAETELPALLTGGLPAGARLHVIERSSTGTWEPMQSLERTLELLQRDPPRLRVQHSLWRGVAR